MRAMTLAYVAASRRSRLLAYLGSMLLSETKVTQQSHQEVWFGSAEHGSVRLQRRWSWLQLIKCFNITRVRTRLGARPRPRHGLWVRHAGTRAQSNTHGARGLTVRCWPSGARVATWCHAVASWCHWGASWCDGVQVRVRVFNLNGATFLMAALMVCTIDLPMEDGLPKIFRHGLPMVMVCGGGAGRYAACGRPLRGLVSRPLRGQ